MNKEIIIKFAETTNELQQILILQEINLARNISSENKKTNGFVTVQHDLTILKKMNAAAPSRRQAVFTG